MKENNALVFVFPFRGVGGVCLLFLRLAEYLAVTMPNKIYIVDYADGYMARNLLSSQVKFIEYTDNDEVALPDDATLIFQAMTPWSIFPSLRFGVTHKFLFWNCYPYNLVPVMPGIRRFLLNHTFWLDLINNTILLRFKSKLKRFLTLLVRKKSIVFMDEANANTTAARLGVKLLEPTYLPIPAIDSPETILAGKKLNNSLIRFCWVGRIVDFKYFILLRAIERLSNAQLHLNIEIEITVVGDGDYLALLKQKAQKFSNVKLIFIDNIAPDKLDNFLVSNVDILMAMGTAALEGAKLRIPTILLDFSHSEVSEYYRFRWLHEQTAYNLGAPIERQHFIQDDQSLLRLIKEAKDNYEQIADFSLQYFKNNHSLKIVAEKLLRYVQNSNCYYSDIVAGSLFDRGLLYNFFSKLKKLVR